MYSVYFPVTYYFYPLLESTLDDHTESSEFREVFDAASANDVDTLLYVHIPYCHDLCRFCPFHVRVAHDTAIYDRYVNALCSDLANVARTRRGASSRIKAVYFGGGSPSVLSVEHLRRIFSAIETDFSMAPDAEISFEGEPQTLGDPARLELLREHGVQRISFGLQTYDLALRKAFNIQAGLDDVEAVTRHARAMGFSEINVDMMYNLPGQTLAALDLDVRRAIEDGFDSIDYYNLHYFAFPMAFKQDMENGKIPPKPSEPIMLALFEQLRYRLAAGGYANVADQVYSKMPRVCEYFRLLWGGGYGEHRAETLAVGSSARGYVGGFSYMNYGNANRYMDGIESGAAVVEKISSRLRCSENRGAVMFPKFLAIDKSHEKALGTIPEGLVERWISEGLVYETASQIRIAERGKLWTNNMTTDLLDDAQRDLGDRAVDALPRKPGVRTGTF